MCHSCAVPDRDDHLHPGQDRAGMTLNPAGTGMTSKTRRDRDQGHPGRDTRILTGISLIFLCYKKLYVPLDVHIN